MNTKSAKIISQIIPIKSIRHRFRDKLINIHWCNPFRVAKYFLFLSVKNKTILLEMNTFHIECLYSIYYALHNAQSDIIIFSTKENIKRNIFKNISKVYTINQYDIKVLDKLKYFNKCKLIFVNSFYIWNEKNTADKYLTNYIKTGKRFLTIDHAPELYDYKSQISSNIIRFVLADFLLKKYGFPVIYTVVFPREARFSIHNHNFISVGVIGDNARRDTDSYLDILAKNPDIFSYMISSNIYPEYRKRLMGGVQNIKLYQNATFEKLFDCCNDAVFIPFLIHDEIINIYKTRITGNINLALWFCLIPIIDIKLAEQYGLNSKHAIIYRGRDDFPNAIIRAKNMSYDEIEIMRNNIKRLCNKMINYNAKKLKKYLLANDK